MNRGLSIIEQAPLGGFGAPPSPLSFKHLVCSSLANFCMLKKFRFRAKHSGVSNPSLYLSYRGFKLVCMLRLFSQCGGVYINL